MESQLLSRSRKLADAFLKFVNVSRSPFHVVEWCRKELAAKGFVELKETENWELKTGEKYFFTRNQSTIIAFDVGKNFNAKDTGFKIIGTHTDSPCLRMNPVSKGSYKSYGQCHISTYGGGLWHTWFDRDLTLAGKIVHKNGEKYTSTLWESKQALLKIPNLAIHLLTQRSKFQPNTQTHLKPICSSTLHSAELTQQVNEHLDKVSAIFSKHNEGIIRLISQDTKIKSEDIVDFDLYFADSNPSSYVGLNSDFISSARLDNLFSSFHGTLQSYLAISSLIETPNEGSYINMAALFDHEECGSESAQGAGSNIIYQSLYRIYKLLVQANANESDNFQRTMQKSFLISADMAHGIHPNYSQKHQSNHQVEVNKGIVIKTNFSQRYATDLVSGSILKILAEKKQVPIQEFVVRNDTPCGSTIGPILASKAGIKAVDIGAPMLGMHSIRETCGILDGSYYRDLFSSFYENYEKISHDLLEH